VKPGVVGLWRRFIVARAGPRSARIQMMHSRRRLDRVHWPVSFWCGVVVVLALVACDGGMVDQGTAQEVVHSSNVFRDPLDSPAERVAGALELDRQPIIALDRAGKRLIGVGLRGVIVLSEDDGNTWRQAKVPVRSDLVALSFPTTHKGWAVGHDGVILHTVDGGETWAKQLDGATSAASLTGYYQTRIEAGETELQPFLDEVILNTRDGPVLPFLSVYFENEKVGYAVGSFGMLLTTTDGGKNWQPALERIDNPGYLNLNGIRRSGDGLYIAGERGTVWRLDRSTSRFVAESTEYAGSFFGVVGTDDFLVAYGLSGTAFRSADQGRTWEELDSKLHNSVTAATLIPGSGRVVLVAEDGKIAVSQDSARNFELLKPPRPMLFAAVVPTADHQVVLAGLQGLSRFDVRAHNGPTPTVDSH